jgi:hypothetical protein
MQMQVDTVQTGFDRLTLRMNHKVNIDNFEHALEHKAERETVQQLNERVQFWQKYFRHTIIVLNESLQLHSQRADETV